MGMTSQVSWSGSEAAPFSSPDLAFWEVGEQQGLFVTEWATGVTADENRHCPRHSVRHEVLITDPDWWETENPLPLRGECLNLSDDGLYVVVPWGYGLSIGQRYLFHLRTLDGEEICRFGTIVRTEVLRGHAQDRMGIGVKLAGSTD